MLKKWSHLPKFSYQLQGKIDIYTLQKIHLGTFAGYLNIKI